MNGEEWRGASEGEGVEWRNGREETRERDMRDRRNGTKCSMHT